MKLIHPVNHIPSQGEAGYMDHGPIMAASIKHHKKHHDKDLPHSCHHHPSNAAHHGHHHHHHPRHHKQHTMMDGPSGPSGPHGPHGHAHHGPQNFQGCHDNHHHICHPQGSSHASQPHCPPPRPHHNHNGTISGPPPHDHAPPHSHPSPDYEPHHGSPPHRHGSPHGPPHHHHHGKTYSPPSPDHGLHHSTPPRDHRPPHGPPPHDHEKNHIHPPHDHGPPHGSPPHDDGFPHGPPSHGHGTHHSHPSHLHEAPHSHHHHHEPHHTRAPHTHGEHHGPPSPDHHGRGHPEHQSHHRQPLTIGPNAAARMQYKLQPPFKESIFHEVCGDMIKVSIDLPGVKLEHLQVKIENQTTDNTSQHQQFLLLSANRMRGEDSMEFNRRFELEKSLDVGKLQATLKDGVLIVTFPKKKEGAEKVEDADTALIDVVTEDETKPITVAVAVEQPDT